jgi:hypothetical protein
MNLAKQHRANGDMAEVCRLLGTIVTVGVFFVLALGSTESKPTTSGDVKWSKYAPEVRTRIDRLINEKDCRALQREFDVASENDDATRSRTGDGNGDLMGYIDDSMRTAGCYK